MVLEQTVRVLAEAAVSRTPRRLDVRDVPVRRSEHAQKRLRVHRAGADLDVERLLQRTPPRRPELGQLEDQALERHRAIAIDISAQHSRALADFNPFPGASPAARDAPASSSRSTARGVCRSASANGLRGPRRVQKRLRVARRARVRLIHALRGAAASTRSTARADRTGTPAAIASTIDAPSRNNVSFGSASGAHSSMSSAKYPT